MTRLSVVASYRISLSTTVIQSKRFDSAWPLCCRYSFYKIANSESDNLYMYHKRIFHATVQQRPTSMEICKSHFSHEEITNRSNVDLKKGSYNFRALISSNLWGKHFTCCATLSSQQVRKNNSRFIVGVNLKWNFLWFSVVFL